LFDIRHDRGSSSLGFLYLLLFLLLRRSLLGLLASSGGGRGSVSTLGLLALLLFLTSRGSFTTRCFTGFSVFDRLKLGHLLEHGLGGSGSLR